MAFKRLTFISPKWHKSGGPERHSENLQDLWTTTECTKWPV